MLQAVGGTAEFVEAEGLQQIVHGIHLEALHGVFRVGGGEHHEGWCGERLHEVHPVEVGHVDVAEDGVDVLIVQYLLGLKGALAFSAETEKGYLLDVGSELLQSQWLVVDG